MKERTDEQLRRMTDQGLYAHLLFIRRLRQQGQNGKSSRLSAYQTRIFTEYESRELDKLKEEEE